MVRLNARRVDREHNNTPILSHKEIDEYAHKLLADYKPELLHEPGAINFQHFLESYLGMRIDFQDIYSDPERPILAMTVFKRGRIKVFDKERKRVKQITVPERTVVIDNAVMEHGRESLALFTGMHEGGHITMHWHVYTGASFDGEEYDPDFEYDRELGHVVCRREDIESRGIGRAARTAEQWRERHADYFAAATAMPNVTFIC
jgi:hypothetical protein